MNTMQPTTARRQFLKSLGVSAGAAPFLTGLPGFLSGAGNLCAADNTASRKRVIFLFSPNGTIPDDFWPKAGPGGESDFQLGRILQPLAKYRDRLTFVKGLSNLIEGDGDGHQRGMSCLLTATELFPGNIQGGSNTPAGWAKGISIDQEIKNFLQSNPKTTTRFGSLEFGVAVPDRADPWTRMSYAGPNQPVAPIDDPRRIMEKLYGRRDNKETLDGIVDHVSADLAKISSRLSSTDRQLLDKHLTLVRELEKELSRPDDTDKLSHPMPDIDPKIELVNENTPRISRIQIDLLVNAMANDMSRVATLQYMRSVGQARMDWLGVQEGHHELSHEPDNNAEAYEKLIKINTWFCGEIAYLTDKLASTPEPGGDGTMLDHTLIVWLNELGKGNSHTLHDIPFLLIGGEKATGFRSGRSIVLPEKTPHNRLWMALAHAFGHPIKEFGNAKFCADGPISLS